MTNDNPSPLPVNRFSYRDAGVVGLRHDLEMLSSRELLDEYSAMLMLPDDMLHLSASRLGIIRDILLDRLDKAAA